VAAAAAAVVASVAVAPQPAGAESAPDAGVAWEPPPMREAVYGIRPPSADPAQVRVLHAADGTELYTETWLPAPRDGRTPPARVPVVVQYTPYALPGAPDSPGVIDLLVPRGYGVTFAHVRGTGASGGCIGLGDQHEVDDGALIVEDAGERAPWASGHVGMVGGSYPGGTQIAVATGPDRDKLETLDAIAVLAPSSSLYDVLHHDGVPHLISGVGSVLTYLVSLSNPTASPQHLPERPGCALDELLGVAVPSGDYTPFFEERDHPRNLGRLEAATLMVHGTADRRVSPLSQAGLFDRIPAGVPRAGLFGVFGHESPSAFAPNVTSPRKDWERADFDGMLLAWFDRHLLGLDNGVDGWPTAQVQGTDGQWRTASDWPSVPGPARSLLLGPGGVLGATEPTGATTYLEAPLPELEADGLPTDLLPGTTAVFTTPPMAERLELVGGMTLDLWVQLLVPDSHLTARLEVVDDAGQRILPEARTVGARSAQHLQPIVGGRFVQRAGSPAPVGQPVLVTLRFDPTDLVVPPGAHLRLTVAGSSITWDGLDGVAEGLGVVFQGPTFPSMAVQPVTILHDAAHPSALHATLPEDSSVLLDVREKDQVGRPLGAAAAAGVAVDGGLGQAAAPSSAGGSATGTDDGPRLPATGGPSELAPLAAALLAAALLLRRLAA
jgi:predicted acyl esterase